MRGACFLVVRIACFQVIHGLHANWYFDNVGSNGDISEEINA